MTPEPEVLLAQWSSDVSALVRDHAEFCRRLDAACFNRTPRDSGRPNKSPERD